MLERALVVFRSVLGTHQQNPVDGVFQSNDFIFQLFDFDLVTHQLFSGLAITIERCQAVV